MNQCTTHKNIEWNIKLEILWVDFQEPAWMQTFPENFSLINVKRVVSSWQSISICEKKIKRYTFSQTTTKKAKMHFKAQICYEFEF